MAAEGSTPGEEGGRRSRETRADPALRSQLELSYEVKEYKRNTKTMLAGPELKAIHPLGKVRSLPAPSLPPPTAHPTSTVRRAPSSLSRRWATRSRWPSLVPSASSSSSGTERERSPFRRLATRRSERATSTGFTGPRSVVSRTRVVEERQLTTVRRERQCIP